MEGKCAVMEYFDSKGELCSPLYYEQFRDEFVQKCQVIVDEHMKQYSWEQKLSMSKGRRYDKIVSTDTSSHAQPSSRVWGFIDKTNGDILKPESWRKPAKHARGNIYESPSVDGRKNDDSMQFIGPHGPAYMDTIKEYYGV